MKAKTTHRWQPWILALGSLGVLGALGSCRPDEENQAMDMAQDPGACQSTLPAPPAGQRCVVTPAKNMQKGLVLRGTLLLPDKVLPNGEVVLDEEGRIACVAEVCGCAKEAPFSANAATVSCKDSVISPGLINAHDHITFTKAAPAVHGENRYDHRHEWRRGVAGDPNRPAINVPGGNNASAVQWGEFRHLLSGATSILGSGQAKGVLRNLDTTSQEGLSENPVDYDTFPLGDSGGQMIEAGCAYPNIHNPATLATLDAYLPHVGEGISTAARNEFLCLSSNDNAGKDHLNLKTAMVHAIALSAEDAKLTAARRAAVVWSPRSNVDLYGHTAQIPMLDRAGVLIALGTDWSASGSMNMLRELRCASDLNQRYFNKYLSAEKLWKMATLNAALASSTIDALGQLKKGLIGDIAIYQTADNRKDHQAVVDAELKDVVLVLRGGLPMYGDAAIMEGLSATTGCETLDVCGAMRRLCVERETGKKLADLETAAGKPIYTLFACEAPPSEPSCVPFRRNEFTGMITAEDPDGDGLTGMSDNCPQVFNPIRPMDKGAQPDSDADGVGDACDPCPLDKNGMICMPPDPGDRDADGVPDTIDNCLLAKNTDQKDADMDGQGDACDGCPAFANPMAGPCPFSIKELRDPNLGKRPKYGTKVVVQDLLVVGLRDKASYGFHARDLKGSQDYAGIMVYIGGNGAPKATDGTPMQVGMVVTVRGIYSEFQNQDQLEMPTEIRITGKEMVEPLVVKPADLKGGAMMPAERLESLLVQVKGVTMRRMVPPAMMGGMEDDFYVSDDMAQLCDGEFPSCARIGDFLLDNGKNDMSPPFTQDGTLQSVTGVVSGFRNFYSVEVRSLLDISK